MNRDVYAKPLLNIRDADLPRHIADAIETIPHAAEPDAIAQHLMQRLPHVEDLFMAAEHVTESAQLAALMARSPELRQFVYLSEPHTEPQGSQTVPRISLERLSQMFVWVVSKMNIVEQEGQVNGALADLLNPATAEIGALKFRGVLRKNIFLAASTQIMIADLLRNDPDLVRRLPVDLHDKCADLMLYFTPGLVTRQMMEKQRGVELANYEQYHRDGMRSGYVRGRPTPVPRMIPVATTARLQGNRASAGLSAAHSVGGLNLTSRNNRAVAEPSSPDSETSEVSPTPLAWRTRHDQLTPPSSSGCCNVS